jgi:hypothetical protein
MFICAKGIYSITAFVIHCKVYILKTVNHVNKYAVHMMC